MFTINIRLLAKQDIQEVVNYYDDISTKFTRVSYLKNFPFGIHFLIQVNSIEILAIIHTDKNPKTRLKRN